MSYEDGESYILNGRVYPSARAMVVSNRWHRWAGLTEPYPNLTSYYAPDVVATALEVDRRRWGDRRRDY